jgi:hypothetical protein
VTAPFDWLTVTVPTQVVQPPPPGKMGPKLVSRATFHLIVPLAQWRMTPIAISRMPRSNIPANVPPPTQVPSEHSVCHMSLFGNSLCSVVWLGRPAE